MLPSDLKPEQFIGYPPEARKLVTGCVAALHRIQRCRRFGAVINLGELAQHTFFYSIERKTMDRRDFLKTTSTVIAGATLAPGALASRPALPGECKPEGRMVLPINRNWRYNKAFVEGPHPPHFDDSGSQPLVLPPPIV